MSRATWSLRGVGINSNPHIQPSFLINQVSVLNAQLLLGATGESRAHLHLAESASQSDPDIFCSK